MIGEVKERDVGTLKPLGPILTKNPTGFPQPRSSSKKSLAAHSGGTFGSKTTNKSLSRQLQTKTIQTGISNVDDDFSRGNSQRVESMTTHELAEAVDEISTFSFPKDYRFVEKKGMEPKQQQKQIDQTVNDSSELARGKDNELYNVRNRDAPIPPLYDIKSMPPHIATSLDELESIKQRAPAYVKERLAWTEHKPENSHDQAGDVNDHSPIKNKMNKSNGVEANKLFARTMHSERFDLSGRKIVDVQSISALIGIPFLL